MCCGSTGSWFAMLYEIIPFGCLNCINVGFQTIGEHQKYDQLHPSPNDLPPRTYLWRHWRGRPCSHASGSLVSHLPQRKLDILWHPQTWQTPALRFADAIGTLKQSLAPHFFQGKITEKHRFFHVNSPMGFSHEMGTEICEHLPLRLPATEGSAARSPCVGILGRGTHGFPTSQHIRCFRDHTQKKIQIALQFFRGIIGYHPVSDMKFGDLCDLQWIIGLRPPLLAPDGPMKLGRLQVPHGDFQEIQAANSPIE